MISCLEQFRFDGANPAMQLLSCGHAFCRSCINTWARNHNTCLICTANLEAARAIPISRYSLQKAQVVKIYFLLSLFFFIKINHK